mmetsp:Transcript_19616/g.75289  ORF Transcript_19616/g.75289 Transcript_19616/m.75289 type:complete len:210 (-) Transcript_19616:98-727(-)|eukprot:CAMPEP_0114620904 /NCGR_PEP_ID=MMETSP0168-20121206/8962_1 /TAXON_ID=95228 ORGANISM="Vannella sp., Strain DIVA3 517/6/12" /NCGR_SAMPLE_ID=MMETSP0168 /ASSEMBLY_ACC=CAM_ASM_000044 /LENGTH=209 /DNA_ID=CAMNT_0001832103 /DNA_START=68 /DNA_END=697 /DNA_ORIENTATION=-
MSDVQSILDGPARFEEASVEALEKYHNEQLAAKQYNFDANAALIKLYQFYPARANEKIVVQVLGQALMNLPKPDFTLCLHMLQGISEGIEAVLEKVTPVSQLLEGSQFTTFWASEDRQIFKDIPGFDDAVRQYALGQLQLSYQKVSKDLVKKYLQIDDAAVDALAKEKGFEAEGGSIRFPLTCCNQATPKLRQDNLQFQQLNRFVSHLR